MTIPDAKQMIRAYCMTTDCSQCSFHTNGECDGQKMIPPCLWKNEDEYERIAEARSALKDYCLFCTKCSDCVASARGDCEQDSTDFRHPNATPMKIPAAWYVEDMEDFDDDEENEL